MNQKASVTKELNARHSKILEGLLKLPENRECADCQSRGPRWASVNLGIFICMQCSGIHRSLGVHISQVRSITLDTWLPEQVAFMQSMGNEKSNKYWEAEHPPDCDRRSIEKFIRAKYADKGWVRKGTTQPIPIPADKSNVNKFVDGRAKSTIPRRTRNYSLEEKIFTQHIEQLTPPPLRSRKGSLDMNTQFSSPPQKVSPLTTELNTPAKKTNGTTDVYSLLYVGNANHDHSSVVPSRWATFDCESQNM
ncbi:hypothetical protein ACOSP7_023874 [Xanthoceras sorbifolium]|uniref:Arf-GAP domain-containing protein n=1 Tax=Xanthoceras sorbifolium TaxID=99658 RepID=A0ABQ8H9Q0_9ROSI|nr:hypothetical protein JRO89_XS13G0236300 [Xanthoceras sorbifolium]